MAALENLKDMYDIALKPRMLRALLKEDIPDEKKLLGSSSKLSRVVSTIRTFKLLSESFTSSMEPKLIERWKSAMDEWVNRLLFLVSNPVMPDKRWAGVSLLGVTCQECSSDRFLASYAVWFDKMLVPIQSPADSQFVKVASCTALSDLLVRLAGFPSAKKDGTSHAGKVILPVLKLLQEDCSENVWEGAIHLLHTVIVCFPASVHRHYDCVETVIASKFLSGKCSINVLKMLAYSLALLPKSKGDEDSWLSMLRKILLLVNSYLNEIFNGLEEESKWDEALRLLVPLGEPTPTSLWGQNLLEETSDSAGKRSKLSFVSMLMLSCCTMLTTSYPTKVTVPVRSLLALTERVLMVDGSLLHATSPYVIATEQEFICSELPVLHSYGLELLTSVIKGMRSQLLPHAAYVVRLVKEYFRRCQLSGLKIKIYSITKILLLSMGIGIAIYLAQEVVNNSLFDLNSGGCGGNDTSSSANPKSLSEAFLQSSCRKRKHGATGSHEPKYEGVILEGPMCFSPAPISLKIAALEAIEALLTVGGALRSESWRSKVDHLLITMAADASASKWGWNNVDRNTFLHSEPTPVYADLQLAIYRALLASLLSPSLVCRPHLARSLELFRKGRQETGTKLSEFCSYALLALEVLIHPRALPLVKIPAANEVNLRFNGLRETGYVSPDSDDELYKSWLGSDNTPGKLRQNISSMSPMRGDVKESMLHLNEQTCSDPGKLRENISMSPMQGDVEESLLQLNDQTGRDPGKLRENISMSPMRGDVDESMLQLNDQTGGEGEVGLTEPFEADKHTLLNASLSDDDSSAPDIVDTEPDSD